MATLGTLSQPEGLSYVIYVSELLETEDYPSRTDVAVQVCEEFGFQDPRGQHQLGGCLKALRELEAKGWFQLPAAEIEKGGPSPRRVLELVAEAQGVPAEVGAIVGLELVRVEQENQMRIWNELMIREHPQGAGPLVRRQIRYLVHSARGWLGGLGFAPLYRCSSRSVRQQSRSWSWRRAPVLPGSSAGPRSAHRERECLCRKWEETWAGPTESDRPKCAATHVDQRDRVAPPEHRESHNRDHPRPGGRSATFRLRMRPRCATAHVNRSAHAAPHRASMASWDRVMHAIHRLARTPGGGFDLRGDDWRSAGCCPFSHVRYQPSRPWLRQSRVRDRWPAHPADVRHRGSYSAPQTRRPAPTRPSHLRRH